ncbi:MAG TPA: gephyrin-like molybdotransferase Glp [Candidatus Binatus sp.]|jgi:molybdopterin molybdotransferase|nr:gephyrin-like molybdotransferase Glp [Candidatus Binatus sp.]
MLSYEQARQKVIEQLTEKKGPRATEQVRVGDALGYVLAQEVKTDREYPPFNRATRDGYAVFAADAKAGVTLKCTGEIKAGDRVTKELSAGTCAQIMTGAAVPSAADAVVMIEHTKRDGDEVRFERDAVTGQNFVPRGSEARTGQTLLTPGMRLGYAELALAAQVGAAELKCAQKPRVAILSTGDEIVPVDSIPGRFQIRNSNSVSLAAQVRLAGGEPVLLGNAMDREDDLSSKIRRGLQEDLLVLSGGVSMGKYDLVEKVLREMGAEFYFDAVAIRPGKPAVFGKCGEKFVFGLPGNPVSTMVTFELFVAPAVDLLSGAEARELPILEARLGEALHEKPGLTHFLPARMEGQGAARQVLVLKWQGSGDVAALGKANCFVVVPAKKEKIEVGENVEVMVRRDLI